MLFVNCRQPGSHVRGDFQRQPYVQSACAFDEILERFSFNKLHRVEVILSGCPQMEDRRNIRVANARRYTGFAQKPKPGGFITQVSLADDLQCHEAVQIDVERLVSHPHRATTQFERFPVFAHHQLVVVKSFRWLVRCRLDRFLVDSPDTAVPGRAPRSMHTGQNSIAPENSLPQLGQVRWGSVVMIYPPVLSRDRSTPGMKPCRALHWRTMIAFTRFPYFTQ